MKLLEVKGVTLFHGDNVGTTNLSPEWMLHGSSNNQEGVGIYFSPDIDVAKSYGSKISKLELSGSDLEHIVDARSIAADIISTNSAVSMLSQLNSQDDEFWYLLTDYGIEVSNQEDVDTSHLSHLYSMMKETEIRNFQIELCEATNVNLFVPAWNSNIGIYGLFESVSNFYSIINTKLKVTPVNF